VIVIDASAIVELILRTPVAPAVRERLGRPAKTLHAPHLIDIEVAQVVRRYAAIGQIEPARGRSALGDLFDLTADAAAYIALAETLDATLLTRDRRLAAASGHRARVELV
jgi:predicted nucleic acid-binding protein